MPGGRELTSEEELVLRAEDRWVSVRRACVAGERVCDDWWWGWRVAG